MTNPYENKRIPQGRRCNNPKCTHVIPTYITKLTYYKCPKCGTIGSADRGGAR